jgi:site-specific DNA-methyltransferase (cytosine-N4-specific)
LIAEIGVVENVDERDALKVAFSSFVVRVSNQESDTRYAAVEKRLSAEDIWPIFMRAVQIVDAAVLQPFAVALKLVPKIRLLTQNILATRPEDIGEPVGLVITSPPYPNAYEYWLYHKYRMYWLGMDPIAVRQLEIGARPHYFKKNPKTAADFLEDMTRSFALFREVMVKGAYVCLLIGRSIISGKVVNNAEIVREAALVNGFKSCGQVERAIPSNRKAFNPSHGTISVETLLVFQRA